jgi:hypothetical protein
MAGMTSRPAPYAGWRALAATVLVMAGATGAHAWAGGHLPQWPGLVGLAAVVLPASLLVLGRHASWQLLLPAVVAAQALLHTSFVATTHTGHAGLVNPPSADPWTGRMLLAHAVVTVLTLVVWRLCGRAAMLVVRRPAVDGRHAGRRRVRSGAGSRPVTPRPAWLVDDAPRRGPPTAYRPA